MFDSGALRLLVLGLIAEEPRHGYDIIRDLRARFQGSYSPSPGSIYPILQQLAEAGLVDSSYSRTVAQRRKGGGQCLALDDSGARNVLLQNQAQALAKKGMILGQQDFHAKFFLPNRFEAMKDD